MAVTETTITERLALVVVLLASIFIIGTAGFHLIEGWELLDAFFMTLITITTIGYREISPLSKSGKIFDMFIIFMGVGTAAYGFASIAKFIVEGEIQSILGRRRLDKTITRTSEHYIVCGIGRIGSLLWKELKAAGKPFVVIDNNAEAIAPVEEDNSPFIFGDATKEDTLIKAGITRAKGLIATASSDVTNVYITLIAKELNPNIFVLARATTEDSFKNLKRAGADKVISPYLIGGRHMANIILKPTVVDFVELASGGKKEGYYIQMEGFKIKNGSCLIDATLEDAPIRDDIGMIVVAIKDGSGKMIFNPPADQTLCEGDVLVCIGDQDAFDAMKKLVKAQTT